MERDVEAIEFPPPNCTQSCQSISDQSLPKNDQTSRRSASAKADDASMKCRLMKAVPARPNFVSVVEHQAGPAFSQRPTRLTAGREEKNVIVF